MVRIFIIYDNPNIFSNLLFLIGNTQINVKIIGLESHITKSNIYYCNMYKPDVIISKKSDKKILQKVLSFKYIHIGISNCELPNINRILNQLIKISSNIIYLKKLNVFNLKLKTKKKLINLQFNPCLIGTTYLLDFIVCLKENPYSQVTYKNVTNQSYNHISLKYNTPQKMLLEDLHFTFEDMIKYTSSEFRHNIYGQYNFITINQFLKTI